MLAWAHSERRGRVELWVSQAHASAARPYEQIGFVATGATRPMPSNPALTTVEMALADATARTGAAPPA